VKRYRFLEEALLEYEDAIEYYELAQAGLGDTFLRDVERVLALALEFPEIGARVRDTPPTLNVRRVLVRRFSVEVDYAVTAEELIVVAIFHGKRRPGYWRDRLRRIRPK
jgi:plasmid stabilization system protein ParE